MKRKHYVLIGIAAFLVYSALVEPYWITQRTHDLVIPGLWSAEIKVVHIADIHLTKYGRREQNVVEMIARIDPDFVFVTGDLLKSKSNLSSGLTFLSNIRAKYGTYVVLGNADCVLNAALKWKRTPKDSLNYHILVNESVDCGAFTLVGLGDPVSDRADVPTAFAGVLGSRPVFVLTHFHPDSLLWELEAEGVDFVFSGHTHGGHIGLAAIVGLVPYAYRSRYISGFYALSHFYLDVTTGVGTNIFPLRFLCRPEIVVINLRGG
jgi:predicted MPP superfamily phosphohydrolase